MSNKQQQNLKANEAFHRMNAEQNIMPLRYEVERLELHVRKTEAEEKLRGYSFEYTRDGLVKGLLIMEATVIKQDNEELAQVFKIMKLGILGDLKIPEEDYNKLLEEHNALQKPKNDIQAGTPADTGQE